MTLYTSWTSVAFITLAELRSPMSISQIASHPHRNIANIMYIVYAWEMGINPIVVAFTKHHFSLLSLVHLSVYSLVFCFFLFACLVRRWQANFLIKPWFAKLKLIATYKTSPRHQHHICLLTRVWGGSLCVLMGLWKSPCSATISSISPLPVPDMFWWCR